MAGLAFGSGLEAALPPLNAAVLILPAIATLKWTLFRLWSETVESVRMIFGSDNAGVAAAPAAQADRTRVAIARSENRRRDI
jgi:hypothetical protein